MDVTSRYVLDFAREFAEHNPGASILDFGCGAGQVVAAGIADGLNIRGADVFYQGSNARTEAESSGLLGGAVLEIAGGRLPFPDACFHLVVNNQVMEHVENLDAELAEIDRVLKPGGAVLSIFPSRDVWREGHIGIPFAHWFRPGSRVRLLYTWGLRSMGAGTWKEQAPTCRKWAQDKLAWIDTYTHYRSRNEILASYGRRFRNELRERDYIRYRLRAGSGDRVHRGPGALRKFLANLLSLPLVPAVASAIFRKLAFLVIVSRKERA